MISQNKKDEDSSGDLFLFETSGFSMWPFIRQGERLLVKRVFPDELRRGDLVLYQQNEKLVCHRLI